MADIHVILIQSMTGGVSDYVYDRFWRMMASDDALTILASSDSEITEQWSIKELVKDDSNDLYVIEAHTENLSYINQLFRSKLVSKMIIYTIPLIDSVGLHLFEGFRERIGCRCDSSILIGNVIKTVYTIF